MEIQRVFVKPDKTAVIKCHACGAVKNVDTKRLSSLKHVLKVQCSCKEIFPVRFEFRMSYRKQTDLLGVYLRIYNGQGKDSLSPKNKMNCKVENISMHGAGFSVMGQHMLAPGDPVCLGFTLDDARKSWVVKTAAVKSVLASYVGVEFDEPANNDKALGFYLMP